MREWLHLLGPISKRNDPPKWFERDDGDARLAHDRRLLAERYPDLEYRLNFRLQKVVLRGTITLTEEITRIPTRIRTRIEFRDDYPEIEPFALDAGDHFPHIEDRHFYKEGGCCLWLPVESQWERENQDSLLNFVDQVSLFFERQLIYDAGGGWAWGERGHREAGYIEFLEERFGTSYETIERFLPLILERSSISGKARCPCGNGRKYNACHKQHVDDVKSAMKRHRDTGVFRLFKAANA